MPAPASGPEIAPEPERIALRTAPPPSAAPTPRAAPPAAKPEPPKNRLDTSSPVPRAVKKRSGPTWVLCPTRALLPSTVVIAAVSAGWILGVMPRLPAWWQSLEVWGAVPGALITYQLVRITYRLMAGCYGLTANQLVQHVPGPLPDPPPIDLATVATVSVEAAPAEMLLLVGRLKLTFERDSRPPEVLGPVGLPRRRARQLEEAIATARAGTVAGVRAA